jgi:hypothetical protein
LQALVDAMMETHVYDRWFARRLPQLVLEAGFEVELLRGHSYVEAPSSAGYMLALVDRGAASLTGSGMIGEETADAMRAEARRRSDAGEILRPYRLRQRRGPQARLSPRVRARTRRDRVAWWW